MTKQKSKSRLTCLKQKLLSAPVKALIVTLGLIGIFRLGTVITIPGVSPSYTSMMNSSNLFQLLGLSNVGTGLNAYTFFSLGVMPFVSASILVQLLGLFGTVKQWRDQGDSGRFKQQLLTRFLAIGFGIYQIYNLFNNASSGISITGMSQFAPDVNLMSYIVMGIVMLGGVYTLSFLGDKITQHGLGNGQSVIIGTGILANLSTLPTTLSSITSFTAICAIIGSVVVTTVLVILFNYLTVKLPIVTSGSSDGQRAILPIKLNPVGMLPIIFAGVLLNAPSMLANYVDFDWLDTLVSSLSLSTWTGMVAYGALIVVFSMIYVTVQLNPNDIEERLSRRSQHIAGVPTGRPTVIFLNRILQTLGIFSGVVIAILAIIPLVLTSVFSVTGSGIGLLGSSMIILATTLSDMSARYDNLRFETHVIKKSGGSR